MITGTSSPTPVIGFDGAHQVHGGLLGRDVSAGHDGEVAAIHAQAPQHLPELVVGDLDEHLGVEADGGSGARLWGRCRDGTAPRRVAPAARPAKSCRLVTLMGAKIPLLL